MLPLLTALLPFADKVLEKFIPNKAEREKARQEFELQIQQNQVEILKILQSSDAGQVEINKIEASSDDKFKSYWRPTMAWVCVSAYAWQYVIQPMVLFGAGLLGKPFAAPILDISEMSAVLMGLLGLAGLRSFEKTKGVSK